MAIDNDSFVEDSFESDTDTFQEDSFVEEPVKKKEPTSPSPLVRKDATSGLAIPGSSASYAPDKIDTPAVVEQQQPIQDIGSDFSVSNELQKTQTNTPDFAVPKQKSLKKLSDNTVQLVGLEATLKQAEADIPLLDGQLQANYNKLLQAKTVVEALPEDHPDRQLFEQDVEALKAQEAERNSIAEQYMQGKEDYLSLIKENEALKNLTGRGGNTLSGDFAGNLWNGFGAAMVHGAGRTFKTLGQIGALPMLPEQVTNTIGDFVMQMGEDLEADVSEESQGNLFEGELTTRKVVGNSAYLIGNLASMIIPGGAVSKVLNADMAATKIAAAIPSLVQGIDGAHQSAMKAGLSEKDANLFAVPVGIMMSALDMVGAGEILEKVSKQYVAKQITKEAIENLAGKELTGAAVFQATSNGFKNVMKGIATGTLKGVGSEGVTGALQETGTIAAEEITDAVRGTDGFKNEGTDILKRIAISSAMEALPGGVFGGFTGSLHTENAALYEKAIEFKNDPEAFENFKKSIDAEIELGHITPEQADNVMSRIEALGQIDEVVPDNVTEPKARLQAVNLITERNSLEEKIKNTDKDLVSEADEQALTDVKDKLKKIANGESIEPMPIEPETNVAKEATVEQPVAGEVATPESSPIDPVQETGTEQEVVNEETNERAGDWIRQFKSKGNTLNDGLLGVPIAVWDGSLEILATAIDTGATIADATLKAVEHLRGTEWYKNLTDKEKVSIESEYSDFFDKQKKQKKTKTQKNKLEEAKARPESTEKLHTRTEYQLLIKRIKDEVRGAKFGYKEGKLDAKVKAIERLEKERAKSEEVLKSEKEKADEKLKYEKRKAEIESAFREGALKDRIAFDKGMREVFKGRVKEVLDAADMRGKISPKQVESIVKRSNEIKSYKDLSKFEDYVKKVVDNENYREDLSIANKIRKGLSKKVKSKGDGKMLANNREAVKEFLKINPADVDNIQEYIEIANKVAANNKKIKVEFKDGRAVFQNDQVQIKNQEIGEYANRVLGEIEQRRKEDLASEYKDLVDSGLIDTEKMSLKDIQDVIEATEFGDEGFESAMKNLSEEEVAKKEKALRSFVDYKLMDLERYAKTQSTPLADGSYESLLTKSEKWALDNILNIDTQKLNVKELAKLNEVIENIIVNDDFSGSGMIATMSEAQRDMDLLKEKISKSGIELGKISNTFIKGLASKNMMFDFIAKSSKVAGEMQRLLGVSDIFNGNSRAKTLQVKMIDEYSKIKKGLSRDIDSPENRFRRGVYSRVIQNFGGDEREVLQEFKRQKELVKQSFEKLLGSDVETERIEGQQIESVYNELLEGSNNPSEVTAKLSKINNGNIEIVDFFIKKYEERLDLLEENTKLFSNEPFERVNNYTSEKMKRHSGASVSSKPQEVVDALTQKFFSNKIDKQEARTKLSRSKSVNLNKDLVLDLDFDRVQSERYFETNYDIETQAAINKVAHVFSRIESKELLGGSENRNIIYDSLKSTVLLQKGKLAPVTGLEKAVTNAVNVLQAKGARIALGSISQVIKQYPSVAISTIGNLGKDANLFFKALTISNDIQLFEQFNIGQRGETKAGYNKEVDLSLVDKVNLQGDMKKAINKTQKIGEKIADGIMYSLVKSDVSVARTSWLSYYMQDLLRQGKDINNIDWANEHVDPNQEAAAYAEQMVSRTQNANDASSMSSFYNGDTKGWGQVLKNIAMPFSSFSVNQRMRLTNDVQKLMFGGKKGEAARSLTSALAEQALFSAVKTYVIASVTTAGADALLVAFGFDEKDKEDAKEKLWKYASSVFKDFFFGGIGSMPQEGIVRGINKIYQLTREESNSKEQLIYQYNPKEDNNQDFSYIGALGILPTKIYEAGEILPNALGETDLVVKGGMGDDAITVKVDITEEEQRLAMLAFLIDGLAIAGLSDTEISSMNGKVKRAYEKQMEQRYGGSFKQEMFTKPKWLR